MESISDLLGTIIGCLAAGFIIYNLMKYIMFKFLSEKNVYLLAFITSCILVAVIYTVLNGLSLFTINYILALLFLFIIDFVRFKNREKASNEVAK